MVSNNPKIDGSELTEDQFNIINRYIEGCVLINRTAEDYMIKQILLIKENFLKL